MSNLTVSASVDTFMQSANQAAMRAALDIPPQLPTWEYTDGVIGDGKFTTDSDPYTGTTLIQLAIVPINGGNVSDALPYVAVGPFRGWMVMTGTNGASWTFAVSSSSATGPSTDFAVTIGTVIGDWSGIYAISFIPDVVTIHDNVVLSVNTAKGDVTVIPGPDADTGWTANADVGDKTSVIPSNATLDAMQAALNLVVAGFGDAFVATADKVKALESALANSLRPNA